MRYFYERPDIYRAKYGEVYICNHPVYNICTLYREGAAGLAVIQQRFDPHTKHSWWADIDPWLVDDLYLRPGFYALFKSRAKEPEDGLYPTMAIRQIMWALKMKPLAKARWETAFDHRDI